MSSARYSSRLVSSLRQSASQPSTSRFLTQSRITPSISLLSHSRHNQRVTMATKSAAGEAISQVAQAEGGTAKGSMSAQMQSELSKQQNMNQESQTASSKSPAGEAISQVAKAEGGTSKGSKSAQMQSELSKQQNMGGVSQTTPSKSPAGEAISQVAKAEGGTTKGSQSAQMQSELTKQMNAEQGTTQGTTRGRSKSAAGQAISEVARAEGGTTKGSQSAQMQSELTKQMNAEQGTTQGSTGGNSRSAEGQAISEVARAEGKTTKGSQSAQMQSELTKQMNASSNAGAVNPTNNNATLGSHSGSISQQAPPAGERNAQSQVDREANYQEAVEAIAPKLQNDPQSITKEDANLLHSREHRAHGATEKGRIAAQAQQIVSEKEKAQQGGL